MCVSIWGVSECIPGSVALSQVLDCIFVAWDHCCAFKREVLICEGQFPKQRRGVVVVAMVRNKIWSFIVGHCG